MGSDEPQDLRLDQPDELDELDELDEPDDAVAVEAEEDVLVLDDESEVDFVVDADSEEEEDERLSVR